MEKREGVRFWLILNTPIIISLVVLLSLMVNQGEVVFNNIGVFIIQVTYRFGVIALGVEVLNKLHSKRVGGLNNE